MDTLEEAVAVTAIRMASQTVVATARLPTAILVAVIAMEVASAVREETKCHN